jgi:REP element-mobilizing transposase RayT
VARKKRIQFAGGNFHVWARRVDHWPLFVDADDYRRYIALLAETVVNFGWVLLSFCLMPNHVHFLIELREPNLSQGMQWLQSRYVEYFNARHGREGALFERRYGSRLVDDELYFVTVVQYIEQNPVKAALCATPAAWPWSARGVAAGGTCPPWLADDVLRIRRGELKDGV